MALSPIELFTKQYIEALEFEAKKAEQEIENAYMEAVAILTALYLGRPKSTAFTFTFTKAADPIFEALRQKMDVIFKKYANKVATLSKNKNVQILNRKIDTPDLTDWINRKVGGKTTAQRILRTTNAFKMEIEARLALGIYNGESKLSVIRSVKKFLDNPWIMRLMLEISSFPMTKCMERYR